MKLPIALVLACIPLTNSLLTMNQDIASLYKNKIELRKIYASKLQQPVSYKKKNFFMDNATVEVNESYFDDYTHGTVKFIGNDLIDHTICYYLFPDNYISMHLTINEVCAFPGYDIGTSYHLTIDKNGKHTARFTKENSCIRLSDNNYPKDSGFDALDCLATKLINHKITQQE